MDDLDLLHEYVTDRSEQAFGRLAARHVDLVYSAALRQVRDPHLAEEVTQAVFIILARKARQIHRSTILTGWLYRTTRFVASDVLKSESRRRRREQKAVELETAAAEGDAVWERIAPHLDTALAELNEKDRTAILLRFFENKSLKEVGRALGTDEDAARKRVSRAVEKLRVLLSRSGATLPARALAAILTICGVQAAPAALAMTASTTALAHEAGIAASLMATVKGAIKAMLWSKVKAIGAFGGGCAVVAGIFVFVENAVRLPSAERIVARHQEASGENARVFQARPGAAGTACMTCHLPATRQTPSMLQITAKGTIELPEQGLMGEFEIRKAGADRISQKIRLGEAGEFITECAGNRAWTVSPATGLEAPGPRESEQLRRVTDFLGPAFEEERAVLMKTVRVADFAGKRCYQLDFSSASGERFSRFFDRNSGLMAGSRWSPGLGTNRLAVTSVHSDYKEFSGLLVPTKIVRETNSRRQILTIASVEFEEVPESRLPSLDAAVSRSGW